MDVSDLLEAGDHGSYLLPVEEVWGSGAPGLVEMRQLRKANTSLKGLADLSLDKEMLQETRQRKC